jgi:hypothetical protein
MIFAINPPMLRASNGRAFQIAAVHFSSPSLSIAKIRFQKSHPNEFLQINSGCFRQALWTTRKVRRMMTLTWRVCSPPRHRVVSRIRGVRENREDFRTPLNRGEFGAVTSPKFRNTPITQLRKFPSYIPSTQIPLFPPTGCIPEACPSILHSIQARFRCGTSFRRSFQRSPMTACGGR